MIKFRKQKEAPDDQKLTGEAGWCGGVGKESRRHRVSAGGCFESCCFWDTAVALLARQIPEEWENIEETAIGHLRAEGSCLQQQPVPCPLAVRDSRGRDGGPAAPSTRGRTLRGGAGAGAAPRRGRERSGRPRDSAHNFGRFNPQRSRPNADFRTPRFAGGDTEPGPPAVRYPSPEPRRRRGHRCQRPLPPRHRRERAGSAPRGRPPGPVRAPPEPAEARRGGAGGGGAGEGRRGRADACAGTAAAGGPPGSGGVGTRSHRSGRSGGCRARPPAPRCFPPSVSLR